MRPDNTTKRIKSQGWPFATILGFHISIDVFVVVW